MRTETTPDKTPLPEDTVTAADEEPTSAQVSVWLRYPPGQNKPKWVLSCFIYPSTHIASFQSCLVSSCPQDPAAPRTVQDVSRGSAGAEVAVTTEGISMPADQKQVLARSVTMLLLLTASCALLQTLTGTKQPCSSMILQLSSFSCEFNAAQN